MIIRLQPPTLKIQRSWSVTLTYRLHCIVLYSTVYRDLHYKFNYCSYLRGGTVAPTASGVNKRSGTCSSIHDACRPATPLPLLLNPRRRLARRSTSQPSSLKSETMPGEDMERTAPCCDNRLPRFRTRAFVALLNNGTHAKIRNDGSRIVSSDLSLSYWFTGLHSGHRRWGIRDRRYSHQLNCCNRQSDQSQQIMTWLSEINNMGTGRMYAVLYWIYDNCL